MRRLSVLLAFLLGLVWGCAETTETTRRLPRPSDFPFHATDDLFFNLHWRLEKTPEEVRAVGLVEAVAVNDVQAVLVELRELDDGGLIVNRALGRSRGGLFSQWETRSFTVSLRPKNPEHRFQAKVWGFSYGVGH